MNRLATGVLLLGLAVPSLWGIQHLRERAMNHYFATQTYEDLYYLPPPEWLIVMSLGHREALADLIWMRALIYFGQEFKHRGTVRHLFRYGHSLLGLDPDFKRVYRWIGMAGLYTPEGAPIDFMERSVDVLREGADRFPDDGQLAWDAGAGIAFELVPHLDKDDPRRTELKERANDYMMAAARLGAGPPWLVLTNATQLRKLGEADRALRHLEEMYAMVRDPNVKAQIETQLQVLRSRQYAEAFKRANIEFNARHQAEFSYLPDSIYFFVADPLEVQLDDGDE